MTRRRQQPARSRPGPGALRIVERQGFRGAGWRDAYHAMLRMHPGALLGLLAGAYLLANLLFALAYLAIGGIVNARPGSLTDAFFFSVQTMATIGYGFMYPKSLPANLLVTAESAFGLLSLALATGVLLNRLARPSARVVFSRNAVITAHRGVPTLMFRMANQRRNRVVEARVTLTTTIEERMADGQSFRRFHDLPVLRASSPVFALSWTVMHPITPDSPLHGLDAAALSARQTEILCTFAGLDDTFSQTIHARHVYGANDVLWRRRFADIFSRHADGSSTIDYAHFHETLPESAAEGG